MIKNGRPYTNENGAVDDRLVSGRDDGELLQIDGWIRENVRKSRSVCKGRTSYGLKHALERDTGIYLTNNEFKDAMLLAGYRPVDPGELNWRYRIVMVKEDRNTSPFVRWVREKYDGEASPKGHFASDMARDREFPIFAEYGVIGRYLCSIGACSDAVEVFESLWEEYERENG